MRKSDINAKKFHRGHYEIIAARFREALTPYLGKDSDHDIGAKNALINLALSMAVRFQADSEDFDALIFLDRCSPDDQVYPLSELWAGFLAMSKEVSNEPQA